MDIDSPIATIADLPPELRERRRNSSLGYYIVEVSAPREIDAPPLAPNNVVELARSPLSSFRTTR